MDDEVKIDYFAVSLPNLLIFEDDLKARNQVHCYFLQGLGYLGLHQFEPAQKLLHKYWCATLSILGLRSIKIW
jgi:hypothetical protein